jgi:hypothetical protein
MNPHTVVKRLLEADELDADEVFGSALDALDAEKANLKRLGVINAQTADDFDRFYHRKLRYKTDPSRPLECRRNGRTKRWKTRPDQFSIPVKYGMYDAFRIDNSNAHEWSTVPNPEPAA